MTGIDYEAEVQFREAAAQRGLITKNLIADGRIHRCDLEGKGGKGDGSYLLRPNGLPSGGFQNWRDGLGWEHWHARSNRKLTRTELAEYRATLRAQRKQREAEEQKRHAEAAAEATQIRQSAEPAPPGHPYLANKKIGAHGLRIADDGRLIVPLFDARGDSLCTLQYIRADCSKRFLTGGRKKGCCAVIGHGGIGSAAGLDPGRPILIAEGLATAVSCFEATGWQTVIAFDVDNLGPVVAALKERYPQAGFIIAGDDDWRTRDAAGNPKNPGRERATAAARAIGAKVAFPVFSGLRRDEWTDFNDVHSAEGLDAVRRCIEAAKEPEKATTDEPLDGLPGKAAADPGAPFMPEVLEALAALKKRDRAAFEALRQQLKRASCRVTELDAAIAGVNGEEAIRRPAQSDRLIELASHAVLFHTPDGTGFADVVINDHRETWPLRSRSFKRWLAQRFFDETGGAPNSEALQAALNVIEGSAQFKAPERTAHVRVAAAEEKLYLDLGDEAWRAVEIDESGWRVITDPPVRFRRAAGMKALPVPQPGGSIKELRPFLNVQSESDFVLAVAWLLGCLRERGPYPLLILSGEQGSAKSTFSAMLRSLIDPNSAPLRALPREDRDLFIAAGNGHVLAFDNLSGLPSWISDALCRIASGGGFAARQLYSDDEERLFDAARPIILNGIEDVAIRPDLTERALHLTLAPIPEERRRPEAELWQEFEAVRPLILGALLDAAAKGLATLQDVKLTSLPRMADFAHWAAACETALWAAGTFEAAYRENRDEAAEGAIEADAVACAVRKFMASRTVWTGTASNLLGALEPAGAEGRRHVKAWPDTPRALAGRLRRAAPFLRKLDLTVTFERAGRMRERVIRIAAAQPPASAAEEEDKTRSAPPAPSAWSTNSREANGLARTQMRTQNFAADSVPSARDPTVCNFLRKNNAADDAGGADASNPSSNGADKKLWRGRL
jgi:phage/plasmid primase-like uncharacterized protein